MINEVQRKQAQKDFNLQKKKQPENCFKSWYCIILNVNALNYSKQIN